MVAVATLIGSLIGPFFSAHQVGRESFPALSEACFRSPSTAPRSASDKMSTRLNFARGERPKGLWAHQHPVTRQAYKRRLFVQHPLSHLGDQQPRPKLEQK